MSSTQPRLLLLGLGFWGRQWYEVISRSADCTLAGVAATPRGLDALGVGGTDGPRAYADYREAIEQADADAVVIVLPTALHVDAGTRALEKSMHVLSEKPVASDLAGALHLRADARRRPRQVYMVNQNYRWRTHNQTLKHAISRGDVGRVGGLHLEFRQPEFLVGDRRILEMPLIQDMSVHHFDLIRFLLDANAVEIFARSFNPSWSAYSGLASTEAVIRMENGIVVGYSGTWAARGRFTLWDGDITVTGSMGCLKLDASGQVRLFRDEGQNPDEWSGVDAQAEMGAVLEPLLTTGQDLERSLALFLDSLATGSPPSTSLEDNYHTFAMVAAAEESARTGLPIAVSS
jgi:predicted dehydrogenase